MKRTAPPPLLLIAAFALVALACNLAGEAPPPTLVSRIQETPLPTIGYATLPPEALPQQQAVALAPAAAVFNAQALLAQVEADRLMIHVDVLQNIQTRHVNSSWDDPNRGIGAAYRYIRSQFDAYQAQSPGAFSVIDQPFTVTWNGVTTEQRNIIGYIQATAEGGGVIVVGAHYDSINRNPAEADYFAPGANDNASGVAALLELGRILSRQPMRASIILVAFSAEEIGREGSRTFVRYLQSLGISVDMMLNLDIIGSSTGPNGEVDESSIRLFSEGPNDSGSRQLARAVYWVDYNLLPNTEFLVQDEGDRPGRYGDHQSFSEVGIPAVRFIERLEDRARHHTPNDNTDDIQPGYLQRVTQAALTALKVLGDGLPPPQNFSLRPAENGQKTLIWEPVPGAASYLIGLRSPGSLKIDQQFAWNTNSVTWEGFQPQIFESLVISSVDSSGLMGRPSREFPVR